MPWWVWILAGVAAWTLAGLLISHLVGRAVRLADERLPCTDCGHLRGMHLYGPHAVRCLLCPCGAAQPRDIGAAVRAEMPRVGFGHRSRS